MRARQKHRAILTEEDIIFDVDRLEPADADADAIRIPVREIAIARRRNSAVIIVRALFHPSFIQAGVRPASPKKWASVSFVFVWRGCENVLPTLITRHHARARTRTHAHKPCYQIIDSSMDTMEKPKKEQRLRFFLQAAQRSPWWHTGWYEYRYQYFTCVF